MSIPDIVLSLNRSKIAYWFLSKSQFFSSEKEIKDGEIRNGGNEGKPGPKSALYDGKEIIEGFYSKEMLSPIIEDRFSL